mgnify:CR=1 FL=1
MAWMSDCSKAILARLYESTWPTPERRGFKIVMLSVIALKSSIYRAGKLVAQVRYVR